MAGWNYRIIRHRDPLPKWMLTKKNTEFRIKHYPNEFIEWFAVHEVYYNDNGIPNGVTAEPVKVITDEFTKEEFNRVLTWMKQAVNRPVLDFKTLKEIENATPKSSHRRYSKRSKTSRVRR